METKIKLTPHEHMENTVRGLKIRKIKKEKEKDLMMRQVHNNLVSHCAKLGDRYNKKQGKGVWHTHNIPY